MSRTIEIEIMLADLKEEKQKEIIEMLGDNGNYDIYPIFVISYEEEADSEEFRPCDKGNGIHCDG